MRTPARFWSNVLGTALVSAALFFALMLVWDRLTEGAWPHFTAGRLSVPIIFGLWSGLDEWRRQQDRTTARHP